MALDEKARAGIERTIDELKKRLPLDSNDLDYETHLHTIRMLQRLLEQAVKDTVQREEG